MRDRSKRKLYAVSALIVLLLTGWMVESWLNPHDPRVSPGKIPPVVVVSLAETNSPLRVFLGGSVTFLVLPDGSLWWWGMTWANGLPMAAPVQVGTNRGWLKAFSAGRHWLGLQTNGTLWEWGWRVKTGGAGTAQFSSVPERVDSNQDWIDMAGGVAFSVALKRDGTLWEWGDNDVGQLALGPDPGSTNLVQLGAEHDWTALAGGFGDINFALKGNGTLWFFGEYLGNPNLADAASRPWVYHLPAKVCRETNWISLESSARTLARMQNGEVWQPLSAPAAPDLSATNSCRLIATHWVPGRTAFAWCDIPHLCEVRADGSLWQSDYEVDRKQRWNPSGKWRRVGTRSDWVSVWGDDTAIGLTSDGTLWTWGRDIGQEPVTNDARSGPIWPCQEVPRPLLRLVPTNSETGAR